MAWNYRVFKHKGKLVSGRQMPDWYDIHHAFYDEGVEPDGKPSSIGIDAATNYTNDPDEMLETLEKFKRAISMPVLDYEDFHEIAPDGVL